MIEPHRNKRLTAAPPLKCLLVLVSVGCSGGPSSVPRFGELTVRSGSTAWTHDGYTQRTMSSCAEPANWDYALTLEHPATIEARSSDGPLRLIAQCETLSCDQDAVGHAPRLALAGGHCRLAVAGRQRAAHYHLSIINDAQPSASQTTEPLVEVRVTSEPSGLRITDGNGHDVGTTPWMHMEPHANGARVTYFVTSDGRTVELSGVVEHNAVHLNYSPMVVTAETPDAGTSDTSVAHTRSHRSGRQGSQSVDPFARGRRPGQVRRDLPFTCPDGRIVRRSAECMVRCPDGHMAPGLPFC